ncbi:MAG: hypothetical protein ACXVIY_00005, partial [Mucilaginibacter sp.]
MTTCFFDTVIARYEAISVSQVLNLAANVAGFFSLTLTAVLICMCRDCFVPRNDGGVRTVVFVGCGDTANGDLSTFVILSTAKDLLKGTGRLHTWRIRFFAM